MVSSAACYKHLHLASASSIAVPAPSPRLPLSPKPETPPKRSLPRPVLTFRVALRECKIKDRLQGSGPLLP